MSLLLISSTFLTFEPLQKTKTIQLTNQTKIQHTGRPVMFKIKTNKIDCVDAKPSCGYISGKQGENQINVAIRSLNNTKQYTAKLQILYIAHDRITEDIVQKNKRHFDINEYNENYQAIKNQSNNQVKTILLNVHKKIALREPSPDPLPQPNPDLPPKPKPSVDPEQNQDHKISTKTCLIFLVLSFLVGLLAGFSLGQKFGISVQPKAQDTSIEANVEKLVNPEQETVVETTENIQNSVTSQQVQVSEAFQQEVTDSDGIETTVQSVVVVDSTQQKLDQFNGISETINQSQINQQTQISGGQEPVITQTQLSQTPQNQQISQAEQTL